MTVFYALEPDLSAEEFKEILVASTLAERRPVEDLGRLDKMLRQANIVVTARKNGKLIGVARAISDFSYCCYLSDLAVDKICQNQGIGKKLIDQTHLASGLHTGLFLVSAPAAVHYYPKIGLKPYPCFGIPQKD